MFSCPFSSFVVTFRGLCGSPSAPGPDLFFSLFPIFPSVPASLPCARPCFHGLQRFHAPGPLSRSSAFPCARPAFTAPGLTSMRPALLPRSSAFPCAPALLPRPPAHFFMRPGSLLYAPRPASTAPDLTFMRPGPFPRPPAHSLRPPVKKMLKIYSVRASPSPLCAFFSLDNASGSPRSIRFSKS